MSKYNLLGKVAIITGGSGLTHGTGRCLALEFAAAGANVVVASRKKEPLEKVAAEVKALGKESLAVITDVTIPAQVDNLVNQTVDRFGHIDILVNNVGGTAFSKPENISAEFWNSQMILNLSSTFYSCAAAGKVMIQQKSGKIINIASAVSMKGDPMMAPYAAAKAGVISLTKSLGLAWAQHNINVNCIAPGGVMMPDHSLEEVPDEVRIKQRTAIFNPDGTMKPQLQLPGKPEDIAHLALFLASAASDMMTGETMIIRGFEWASTYI